MTDQRESTPNTDGVVSECDDVHNPDLSVVAPMYNEAIGARGLISEITAALTGIDHEIIIVNDGSSDATATVLAGALEEFQQLRVISHKQNAGQSRALRTGVEFARAPLIATLDGDGQNDPASIPDLLHRYREIADAKNSEIIVAGERQNRQDTTAKKLASRCANAIRSAVLQDGTRDTGCGLKVFRREDFLRLPYFDHMHRYLPALFRRENISIEFVPVRHRARMHGRSKYTNLGRFAVAIRDLLGVYWLNGRMRDPGGARESKK